MVAEHLARGSAAETLAAAYVAAQGAAILARNLRCKAGELDLVCRDGEVLAIVEVRQRVSGDFGGALASVDRRKQRKIIRATRYFLTRHRILRSAMLRFDVIGIDGPTNGSHAIVWIKDAFRAT